MSSSAKRNQALAWIGILAVLAISMGFGWKALRDAGPAGDGPAGGGGRPPSTVIFRPAESRDMVEILAVTGTVRAVRRADVAAREAAAVESIEVTEGDFVDDGAVLARLDGRRLAAQFAEAEAALTASRAELAQREAENVRARRDEEMMRDLWDKEAIAEREYLDSERELKVASARADAALEAVGVAQKRLDLLEVRRADLEVTAPFRGRVVARHVERGEWLREGDPVVTLVSAGEAEAWLQLPERHVATLRDTGPDAVELRVPGRADAIRSDRLSLVPDVEGKSRRFLLIAHVPDPDNSLTPGTSVEATVPLGRPAPRLVIDSDAVLQSFAGPYVLVVTAAGDGPPTARRVPIEVLYERGGETVLAEGGALATGDRVIVEGNERLFPDTPVDPKPWSETRGDAGGPEGEGQPTP